MNRPSESRNKEITTRESAHRRIVENKIESSEMEITTEYEYRWCGHSCSNYPSSGFGGWVRVRADRGVVDSFILIDTHTNTSDSYTHSHSFTVYAPMILSGIRRGVRKGGVQEQWVSE